MEKVFNIRISFKKFPKAVILFENRIYFICTILVYRKLFYDIATEYLHTYQFGTIHAQLIKLKAEGRHSIKQVTYMYGNMFQFNWNMVCIISP